MAIDTRLLAYQRAGTATYIRGILGGLREESAVSVLALGSRRDHDAPAGVPTRRLWTPPHHRWERWALGLELLGVSVLQAARGEALRVLHSPDFISPLRLGPLARVITVHDLAFLRYPELLTAASQRYYGQIGRAVREAERIIAVSETTRRDLLTLVDASIVDKIAVIPEGVEPRFRPIDREEARRVVREKFGMAGEYFLFVGTREPRKNLPRLLEAFRRLRERTGDRGPVLALVGSSGWLSEDLEEVARPLGDAARFLGRVSDPDLVALYRAARAHVLVSLYEGFGLPALEAMACGCPTLVADGSALIEVVGDAGLRVDPRDEDAIADALGRLWEDAALRAELAKRGLARARRFSWREAAKQTLAVYREAVCAS
ncbi:MAG TPA: glycosyltransferase family 1 protein [Chloroflexota bacterium]|nr:glycosyltransferase family 1 protein [Chloroflexota bacterium]